MHQARNVSRSILSVERQSMLLYLVVFILKWLASSFWAIYCVIAVGQLLCQRPVDPFSETIGAMTITYCLNSNPGQLTLL
jgi:Na+/citrate or Na+/malate symporter